MFNYEQTDTLKIRQSKYNQTDCNTSLEEGKKHFTWIDTDILTKSYTWSFSKKE